MGSGRGILSGLSKCLLTTINSFLLIIGLLIFTIGVVIYFGLDSLLEKILSLLGGVIPDISGLFEIIEDVGFSIIVIGAILLISSALGCCGACCQSKVMLFIYVVMKIVLLVGQLVITALLFAGWFEEVGKKYIQDAIDSNYTGSGGIDHWSIAMNSIMLQFNCCGIENYEDFNTAANWNRSNVHILGQSYPVNLKIPVVCCIIGGNVLDIEISESALQCATGDLNSKTINSETGCWDEVYAYMDAIIEPYKSPILGASIGVLAVQLLIIIGSILIIKGGSTKKGDKQQRVDHKDSGERERRRSDREFDKHRRLDKRESYPSRRRKDDYYDDHYYKDNDYKDNYYRNNYYRNDYYEDDYYDDDYYY